MPVKVLLVEDEVIAAENLALRLQRSGYQVLDVVDTGDGAISAVAREQPDIVLMDIMLKGRMDGITAAEYIHQQWQVPVVYMTAFADLHTIERAKGSFPFGYVVKPFRASELIAVMEIALTQHHRVQHLDNVGKQRSDLLSLLCHEFRNPLSTIMMATEMLEIKGDKWDENERQRRLERIKSAVYSLSRLVEDVVMASRAEATQYQPEVAEFNIIHFCNEIVQKTEAVWEQTHHIRFLPLLHRSPVIKLDPNWLSYILHNLLANSAKYSPPQTLIELHLELFADRLLLQVKDQSQGNFYLASTFDPFFRGLTPGDKQGSGLGLAIVQKLVTAQKGEISVNSDPERGTTFKITIPLSS